MHFYLIGVDHKKAPLEVREALYRRRNDIAGFWAKCLSQRTAILITCNRFEIYGVTTDERAGKEYMALFRSEFPQFNEKGYVEYGREDVFRHALRLACGLESQLKGELQILQQLEAWNRRQPYDSPLPDLWQKAILSARQIRIRSGLDREESNIAALIFENLTKQINNRDPIKVIIVGTGKIAGIFAMHNTPRALLSFVAGKNYLKAQELARQAKGKALKFGEISNELLTADVLISATSSPHFILSAGDFLEAASRRDRPLYVFDLATPRDIHPDAFGVKGIVLKNLDDLAPLFKAHNERLSERLVSAENLIKEKMKEYKEQEHDNKTEDRYASQPLSYQAG